MEKQVLAKLEDVKDQVHTMNHQELSRLYDALDNFSLDEEIVRRLRPYCSAVVFEGNVLMVVVKGEKKTVRTRYDYSFGFFYKKMSKITIGDEVHRTCGGSRKMTEDDVVREVSMCAL